MLCRPELRFHSKMGSIESQCLSVFSQVDLQIIDREAPKFWSSGSRFWSDDVAQAFRCRFRLLNMK
jgi:hypothetical protein